MALRWISTLALLIFWLGLPAQADTLRIDGSTGVRPLVVALAEAFEKNYPLIRIEIGEGMSTGRRIEALEKEEIDIAMASHGIDVQSFTRRGLQVHWFAKMAVVFGVHQSVELTDLSEEQICGIYRGQYRNWEVLGGPDLPILALSRPASEVDTEIFIEQMSCFQDFSDRDHLVWIEKSGPLARELAQRSGAIGMTTPVRVGQSKGAIKVLALDGIAPTARNLRRGKYPYARNSYLITKGLPSPALKRFLMFVNSRSGRRVILRQNAVPVR
jgi:phosphate transport system substrate-binding protein